MMATIILIFVILSILLCFWALIDINKTTFKNQTTSSIWLLVVLFFPVFGSLFYFQLKSKFIPLATRKFEPKFSKNNNSNNSPKNV
jgi:Flp pilus assembly protein protease CpaA